MSRAEAHIEIDDLQSVLAIPEADVPGVATAPDEQSISDQQNREALAAELAQARQVLDALSSDLREVDAELDNLSVEREQHRLAVDICGTIDRLEVIGGGAVFWGENVDKNVTADHLRGVRKRVEQFNERIAAIEARRCGVIDRITQQQSYAGFMEDVLFEALEEEERRKQEWVVEREISKLPAYRAFMPWSRGGEDDQRFRKNVATALLVCVIFALVVPFIELPQSILKPEVEVPERIVRLLIESQPKPPVPARAMPQPKPEEKVPEQKPREEAKVQVAKRETEVPQPAAAEPEAPKDQGILAFREKLADVQEEQALSRLGSQAKINSAGDAGPVQRAMLTTNAPGSSGGINLASISRSVGGSGGSGGMTRVATTRATSAIGGIGRPGADRPLSGDSVANSRTDEEIQIVFDRYKSALYRLYNRELRKDPTLRGQMVLKLTIEPDGSVSMCRLEATDMNAPELGAQVVERVKTINFGAKDVAALTILYPIDFLPAA